MPERAPAVEPPTVTVRIVFRPCAHRERRRRRGSGARPIPVAVAGGRQDTRARATPRVVLRTRRHQHRLARRRERDAAARRRRAARSHQRRPARDGDAPLPHAAHARGGARAARRDQASTALGERLASPRRERIYGLTERLRDSPPLAPGVIDRDPGRRHPPARGRLARPPRRDASRCSSCRRSRSTRRSTSRRAATASPSTAPRSACSTSRKTDPDGRPLPLRDRHDAGEPAARLPRVRRARSTRPSSTSTPHLTGRPFVPPDWAFLHWRWRGELRAGDAGAARRRRGERASSSTTSLMYEHARHPGRRVPASIARCSPATYGFARWEWDDGPAAESRRDARSRCAQRGYRIDDVERALDVRQRTAATTAPKRRRSATSAPAPVGATPSATTCGGTASSSTSPTPTRRRWWRDKLAAFVAAYGIDGIKLDRGEEHIPSAATDVWADGRTGREVRNDYPTLQAKIHHDALAQRIPTATSSCSRAPATRARSAGRSSGAATSPAARPSAPAPAPTSGCAAPSSASSAPPSWAIPIWGSDTGGYYQFKDREVFARWLEFSAFSGIMEIGGVGHARAVGHADDAALRRRDDRHLSPLHAAPARAAALHRRGRARCRATGVPLVRPMPFDDPQGPRARATCGTSTCSGPICWSRPCGASGSGSAPSTCPAGVWRSYWDPTRGMEGPAHHHRRRAARRHPGLRPRRRRGTGTVSRAARLSRRSRCRAAATPAACHQVERRPGRDRQDRAGNHHVAHASGSPDEYAIAFDGVPMGSVKPSPAGTATTSAITRGSMRSRRHMPSVTGMSIATTAELLISSVSMIDSAEMITMARHRVGGPPADGVLRHPAGGARLVHRPRRARWRRRT